MAHLEHGKKPGKTPVMLTPIAKAGEQLVALILLRS